MRPSAFLASSLAISAYAAPSWPRFSGKDLSSISLVSDYFNTLTNLLPQAKGLSSAPPCDVSKATMPKAPSPLPEPSQGLQVGHVVIGRGTQNYTCATSDNSNKPELVGAMATLFDVSCMAALYPELLDRVPGMALQFDNDKLNKLGACPLPAIGTHYFTDKTTPYFSLNSKKGNLGEAYCKKDKDTPAPANAAVGRKGEKAVAWLKLKTMEGTSGKIREVYRVTTAGGSAPATCQGLKPSFEVEYATAYWFWREA